jgi:protein-disulfide isomerase
MPIWPILVLIAVLLIAAIWLPGLINRIAPGRRTGPPAPSLKTSLGDPNAPIKVEEFGDYQCPACGEFFVQIQPELMEKYIQTGKVHFTFTPYSFIGPESIAAAQASYCALDQGNYWEYHDLLFQNQKGENQGGFNDANLKGFARDLGLNVAMFTNCLAGGKYAQLVQEDVEYGKSQDVLSVPYFLVNGKPVYRFGLLDAVDAELEAQGK